VHWTSQECHSDIIFVLDESLEIFEKDRALIEACLAIISVLVGKMDIASGGTRVGLITYANDVDKKLNLKAVSAVTSIESAIASLQHHDGKSDTAVALAHVRTEMLTSEAGDRSDIPNVVVLLTEGHSVDKDATKVLMHTSINRSINRSINQSEFIAGVLPFRLIPLRPI